MKLFNAMLLLITASLLWSCSPVDVSGGQTSNQASVGITVFRADGQTVASGATIKLFTPGDTSKTPIDQRELDENGQYNPTELTLSSTSPYHNVVIEYDSAEALFYDSVFITKENLSYLQDDTLAPVGAISGFVKIQPNHTPIAVLVHALGTDIYTKADGTTGAFTIGGLAEGTFNLMFTCSYNDYDVELFDTAVVSGETTTIPDTIEIPYLGIPVIEGLSSSYDTLGGVATISWEKTGFTPELFAGYEVFRTTDLTNWPTTALAIVRDTLFNDTLTAFGEDSLYYRVRVINQSGVSGLPFGVAAIKPVSPVEATTVFSSSLFHVKKQKTVTACSINDSMTIHFGFSNPSRTFSSVSLGNVPYEKDIVTPVSSFTDSVSLFVTHDTSVVISATDGHGKVWSDTVTIDVVQDAPRIISVDSVVTLNVLDTIHAIVEDEYGEIVKYEWDWGNDDSIDSESQSLTVKETKISQYYDCNLIITDDDGNSTEIKMRLECQLDWEYLGSIDTDTPSIFSLKNTLIFQNEELYLFTTEDGITWDQSLTVLDIKLRKVVEFNGSYYAIAQKDTSFHSSYGIYESTDRINWNQLTELTWFNPYMEFVFGVFNNMLHCSVIDTTHQSVEWVLDSDTVKEYSSGPLYRSTDGKIWEEAENNITYNSLLHKILCSNSFIYDASMWEKGRLSGNILFSNYNTQYYSYSHVDLGINPDELALMHSGVLIFSRNDDILGNMVSAVYHDITTNDFVPIISNLIISNNMTDYSIINFKDYLFAIIEGEIWKTKIL